MVARICSADLTQTNGRLLSFQASRKRWMASISAWRLVKAPRRIAPVG